MNIGDFGNLNLLILIGFIALILLRSMKILKSYERLIVFRMGKLLGLKGPGFVLLLPAVDMGYKINLSHFFPSIPPEMFSSFNFMVEPTDSMLPATEYQNVIDIQGKFFLIRRY